MIPDVDREEIRHRLGEALGWSAYNRLVESAPNVRQRGRFRFWQEQLLRSCSHVWDALMSVAGFLWVFEDAPLLPAPLVPWTRVFFLKQIEEWPHGIFPLDETPPDWMAAAWEIDRVREELSGDMARTVSKTGKLAYHCDYLTYLSQSLPVYRQVELFLYLRDKGGREGEFRAGFESAFPECVPFLSPPLPDATQFMGPEDASLTWDNETPDCDMSIGEDIPF